jgi:ABC-type Na+ efflux pump permease subunit
MLYVFLNYSFVPLFIIVPLMVSSIVAANSVVGEKERGTLETLLYTPLTNRELLFSKLLAAFLPAMALALLSFVVFFAATNLTSALMAGFLLLVPTLSMVGLCFTTLVSVRAKTYMEAQQLSGIVVLPIVALLFVQITGVLVLNLVAVAVIAVVLFAAAYLLLGRVARKLQREELIQLL